MSADWGAILAEFVLVIRATRCSPSEIRQHDPRPTAGGAGQDPYGARGALVAVSGGDSTECTGQVACVLAQ